MLLGHYGVAMGAKRAVPAMSLGTLVLAAQLADEFWGPLLLLGVERVRIVPGLMAANPLDFTHYPFTHSLAADLLWGALFGLGYWAIRRYRRGAWVVGAAVVSHWFLDVIVHRPDLPLWPGSAVRVGLGAWRSIPLTLLLDGGLFLVGLWIYARSTVARDRTGRWALWGFAGLLGAIFLGAMFGPPPPDVHTVAISALGLWLFVPWAYWIDRHREPRSALAGVGLGAVAGAPGR
jgi:membrane-bound metal-dependent hydrolase YbcI (DUF457 family)